MSKKHKARLVMALGLRIALPAFLTVSTVTQTLAFADPAAPAADAPVQRDASASRVAAATADQAAQTQASPAAPSAPSDQTAQQAAQPSQLQEVTVTGTQIARNGFQSPQPLSVIGIEDLNNQAAINVADTISALPQMGYASTEHNTGASISDGNAGVSNLDLLGLGSQRTLVLLNGVRVASSSVTGFENNAGAVDTNEFPTALIQRVDVVTGGASSAYGSDAISGVVNFVLNTTFTGLKGSLEAGESTYGDDRSWQGTLTWGTGFADNRGHLELSGSADNSAGVPKGGTRPYYVQDGYETYSYTNPKYTATNGQPYYLSENNVGSSQKTFGGLIYSGPLAGTAFGPGGTIYPFTFGSLNTGTSMVGGSFNVNPASVGTLDPALSRLNLFGRLDYDLGDNTKVYMQYDNSNTHALVNSGYSSELATISSGNPFIPASVQAKMTADGLHTISVGVTNPLLVQADPTRVFDEYLIGATGKLPILGPSWTWDVYATRSSTRIYYRTLNNTIVSNFNLAEQVVTSPTTGAPECASTVTSPNNGCVPYDVFGTGVNSNAAVDYVSGQSWMNQLVAEDAASATLRGEPFSDWVGPVSLSVGGLYRNEGVDSQTDALDESAAFSIASYEPTNGTYHTQEGFIETVVPLAEDLPGAKALDFNGAARMTEYSTSGEAWTWKLGLEYSPISDVRFRLMRSRDIRAPDLGEFFSGGLVGNTSVIDPFMSNQSVASQEITHGNPNLQPEVASEETAGIVYTPSWFEGFTASFDMYDVRVDDSIATSSVQIELNECYQGMAAECALVHPGLSPGTLAIDLSPTNTTFLKTSGFDFEAGYRTRLAALVDGWPGTLSIHALLTHVGDLTTVDPSGEVVEGAGANVDAMHPQPNSPTWKYNGNVSYESDAFSASWTARGFGAGVQDPQWTQCSANCPSRVLPAVAPYYTVENNHVPGAFYMDLSLTWHWLRGSSSTSDVFVAVENLSNRVPNFPIYGVNVDPASYDLLGRMFRGGIRFKM